MFYADPRRSLFTKSGNQYLLTTIPEIDIPPLSEELSPTLVFARYRRGSSSSGANPYTPPLSQPPCFLSNEFQGLRAGLSPPRNPFYRCKLSSHPSAQAAAVPPCPRFFFIHAFSPPLSSAFAKEDSRIGTVHDCLEVVISNVQ